MPRGDGTGPVGLGPMTGWGRGNCVLPAGRAYPRWGRGFARGMRSRWWAAGEDGGSAVAQEIQRLKERVLELEQSLEQ